MESASRFEGLSSRFGPYIEELHGFLSPYGVPFGSPDDVPSFSEALLVPGHLRDGVSSIIRAIIYRERESVSHLDLLEIVLVAVGGPSLEEDAPGLEDPKRKLSRFIGQAMTSLWSMSPNTFPAPTHPEDTHPLRAHESPSVTGNGGGQTAIPRALYEATRISAIEAQPSPVPQLERITLAPETRDPEPPAAVFAPEPHLHAALVKSAPSDVKPATVTANPQPEITSFTVPVQVSAVPAALPRPARKHRNAPPYLTPGLVCIAGLCALLVAPVLNLMHPPARVQTAVRPRARSLSENAALAPLPVQPSPFDSPPAATTTPRPSSEIPSAAALDTSLALPSTGRLKGAHRSAPASRKTVVPSPAPQSRAATPATAGSTVTDLPSPYRSVPGTPTGGPVADDASAPSTPAAVAAEPTSTADPLAVSAGVMSTHLLSAPAPKYPMLAKLTGTEGQVVLQTLIAGDGTVVRTHAVSGPRSLRGAAEKAVRHWRYQPYLLNGRATQVATMVTLDFHRSHSEAPQLRKAE